MRRWRCVDGGGGGGGSVANLPLVVAPRFNPCYECSLCVCVCKVVTGMSWSR